MKKTVSPGENAIKRLVSIVSTTATNKERKNVFLVVCLYISTSIERQRVK